MSPSARGVFLVAAAVALGVGILSSIGRSGAASGSSPAAAVVGSTTTTAPAASQGSTTTTTQALATHSPSSVKVLVANGTSVSGVAGKLKTRLASGGWDLLSPTNTSAPARASGVYYAQGFQGDAQAVAAAAGLGASTLQALGTASPVASSSGAEVIVVIGPDLATTLSQ